MNRNTILAFLLILLSVSFFSSRFYYERILKRPHPSSTSKAVQPRKEAPEGEPKAISEGSENKGQLIQEKRDIEVIEGPDVTVVDASDSQYAMGAAIAVDTIWVETEKLIVGIAELGGRIISVRTKQYRQDPISELKSLEENPYIELVQDARFGGGNVSINDQRLDKKPFLLQQNLGSKEVSVKESEELELVFRWTPDGEPAVDKVFSFRGGEYTVGLTVRSPGLDGKKVGVGWQCGISESEAGQGKSARYDVRKVHLYDGKNVSHISEKKPTKSEESGYFSWIGLTSKYFLVALVSDSSRDTDVAIDAFEMVSPAREDGKKQEKTVNYRLMSKRFASGSNEYYTLYLGPSSLSELKAQGLGLEKVLFGGWKWFVRADIWFPALCEFVLWLLIFLQKGLRDYGVVIIVLTILSRLITYPLTHSSMKSMSRMRELQPKITAIREKHKGSPQKMNQKMMELYKKEGVNPLNPGCLPMFLQMPVFISLFIVLRKSIELRGAGTWLVPWVHDLSKPEVLPIPGLSPLPFEIPLYGSNIALMPIVMAVLTYFQNKATIKDPNQKAMVYFMPVFMLVLFNSFPAGLVLYWTFSSALGLVQQFATDKLKKRTGSRSETSAERSPR